MQQICCIFVKVQEYVLLQSIVKTESVVLLRNTQDVHVVKIFAVYKTIVAEHFGTSKKFTIARLFFTKKQKFIINYQLT